MMNNSVIDVKEESYMFFSIGTYNYAFSVKYVLDIMQLVELEYPESMPNFIAGLLEYNNKIIKIIDLRQIMNLTPVNYSLNSKIMVVKTNNDTFGILIDNVEKIRRINRATFNMPPYSKDKSYIEAIYTGKELSATIINLENIEKKINSEGIEPVDIKNSASTLLPLDVQSKETLHRRKIHYAMKHREGSNLIIKSQDTYITFLLDKNICCIKILHVAGFYKFVNVKLIEVPCTPNFITGVVSIKGRYITVVDLLQFTEGRKTPITKDTNIIVVDYEDYEIGIIADAIGETIDIDENLIKSEFENSISCLTESVMNGNMYLFLNIKKLFEDEKLYIS